MAPTSINCEHEGCGNVATGEWMAADEEHHLYNTFRCDDHPPADPSFQLQPWSLDEELDILLDNNGQEVREFDYAE